VRRATTEIYPGSGVILGHAVADVNGDSVPDIVAAVSDHYFAALDVSKAGTGDPNTGLVSIFQTLTSAANGQAMVGQLDSDPALDLVRINSQNAMGPYLRFNLAGVQEASFTPPSPEVGSSDTNRAALVRRSGSATTFDLVWAGMAGTALGKVGRVDGTSFTEIWSVYLAAGAVSSGSSQPANAAALHDPVVADIDGDGADEIVVGSEDGFVYALRASDGSLAFSLDVGAPIAHLLIADIDKDPELEIVASTGDGSIVAIDGVGKYTFDDVSPSDGGVGGGGTGGAEPGQILLSGRACTCSTPGAAVGRWAAPLGLLAAVSAVWARRRGARRRRSGVL
jgi:outer membrane protein assembly factor BamB